MQIRHFELDGKYLLGNQKVKDLSLKERGRSIFNTFNTLVSANQAKNGLN